MAHIVIWDKLERVSREDTPTSPGNSCLTLCLYQWSTILQKDTAQT